MKRIIVVLLTILAFAPFLLSAPALASPAENGIVPSLASIDSGLSIGNTSEIWIVGGMPATAFPGLINPDQKNISISLTAKTGDIRTILDSGNRKLTDNPMELDSPEIVLSLLNANDVSS